MVVGRNIGRLWVELGFRVSNVQDIRQANLALAQTEQQLRSIQRGAAVAVGALVGLGTVVGKVVHGIEASRNRLRAVFLEAASAEDMKRLNDQAAHLGSTTSRTISDATNAQVAFARAGFGVNDVFAATPHILNMAIAGELRMAEASQLAANTLRAFKLEAHEMGRVADVLGRAAALTNTTVRELAPALRNVAPAASSFGLSVEQIVAGIGALRNVGMIPEQAGTALRNLFIRIVTRNRTVAKHFETLGTTLEDVVRTIARGDLPGVLRLMTDKFDEIDKEDRLLAFRGIFGQRTIAGALELTQSVDKYEELIHRLENAQGSAQAMKDEIESGLPGAWIKLKSAAEGAADAMGRSGLSTVMVWGMKIARGLLIALLALPAPIKMALVASLLLAVAALGAFIVALTVAIWHIKVLRSEVFLTGFKYLGLENGVRGVTVALHAQTAAIKANMAAWMANVTASTGGFTTMLTAPFMGMHRGRRVSRFSKVQSRSMKTGMFVAGTEMLLMQNMKMAVRQIGIKTAALRASTVATLASARATLGLTIVQRRNIVTGMFTSGRELLLTQRINMGTRALRKRIAVMRADTAAISINTAAIKANIVAIRAKLTSLLWLNRVQTRYIATGMYGAGTELLLTQKIKMAVRWIRIRTASLLTNTKALLVNAWANKVNTWATIKNFLAQVKVTIAIIARTIATWAQMAATLALAIVTWVATGAVWALTAALLANPIALIVVGVIALIAALGAVIYLFYKFRNEIFGWIASVWGNLVHYLTWPFIKAWEIIKGWGMAVINQLQRAYNWVKRIVTNPFGALWDGMKGFSGKFGGNVARANSLASGSLSVPANRASTRAGTRSSATVYNNSGNNSTMHVDELNVRVENGDPDTIASGAVDALNKAHADTANNNTNPVAN